MSGATFTDASTKRSASDPAPTLITTSLARINREIFRSAAPPNFSQLLSCTTPITLARWILSLKDWLNGLESALEGLCPGVAAAQCQQVEHEKHKDAPSTSQATASPLALGEDIEMEDAGGTVDDFQARIRAEAQAFLEDAGLDLEELGVGEEQKEFLQWAAKCWVLGLGGERH